MKTIVFDMDGTLADLYGVEDWLYDLTHDITRPYEIAKPLVNLSLLVRLLKRLQFEGYAVGIVTWTAKDASQAYDEAVAKAKKEWLKKHTPSMAWDFIEIVPYGTPKQKIKSGILFDDNAEIRSEWGEMAYTEKEILATLKSLLGMTVKS